MADALCLAVVGNPNCGKSTLFNRLIRKRKAIVGDEPGITRDRQFEVANWDGKFFEMIDTGGLVLEDKEIIPEMILQQAELAMEEADHGIRVNGVRPGLIETDIHASGGMPDRVEKFAHKVPMQRGGMAEEVAEAILWLASDAAGYTTGSFIEVSGGR